MEHENREYYVRLAELKSVVSYLLSCTYPVSAYAVYEKTGISAGNLAWIIEKLRYLDIAAVGDDAMISLPADRSRLFALGRILRRSKIRHMLDRIPDEMTVGDFKEEFDQLPGAWHLRSEQKN